MFNSAKLRAEKKGLDFDIEASDIIVPDFCPALGIRLKSTRGLGRSHRQKNTPTLDRIDPTKGYTKGNVRVISSLANRMKTDATEEELFKFANWIINGRKR